MSYEEIGGNQEIAAALAEFEAKSNSTKISPSSGYSAIAQKEEAPKMVSLVMKYSDGLIQSKKGADYVLLFFVVIALFVSLYLFFGGKKSTSTYTPDRSQVLP